MPDPSWEHKGHTITLTATAKFVTQINGKPYYAGTSLSAAKKAIDKFLEERAKEVTINLPVVMLVGNSRFDEKQPVIEHGTITGIDRDTLKVQGLEKARRRLEYILPDSGANEKLLADFVVATATLKAITKKLDTRGVPTNFNSYSRKYPTQYAEAVKRLQDGYAAAEKGKVDE